VWKIHANGAQQTSSLDEQRDSTYTPNKFLSNLWLEGYEYD